MHTAITTAHDRHLRHGVQAKNKFKRAKEAIKTINQEKEIRVHAEKEFVFSEKQQK
jgi:ADP-dependent phosphofructokinase/glucokinase